MPPTLAPIRTPRYQELVEDLTNQIRSGELVPGSRLPSFTEMREQQGVSQTTVVKVYAHLEQEGLILREPKRGIFVAPQTKRLTGQIGFIGTAFAKRSQLPYAAHLVDGIESIAQREGLRIVLLQQNAPLVPGIVDGVIFNAAMQNAGDFQKFGIPAVSLLTNYENVPSIIVDDFSGARMGVRQLIELGHRRIGALLQSFAPAVHMRAAGYRAALEEANISFEENWICNSQLPLISDYRVWGYESMKQCLHDGWSTLACTALFVQNDMAALGVMDALREQGIRVPEDLSVLSYDGTELCNYTWPSLAAVRVPLEQVAIKGTELLLRMIQGEKVEAVTTMLPAEWKDGGSVAPPKG